ncbi:MAG: CHAT domain-containing protein [Microcoleaceae cyanobacterium]
MGQVQIVSGNYQTALNNYDTALNLQREIQDVPGEAETLNNIAAAYETIGDLQRSIEFYTQAVEIQEKIGDRTNLFFNQLSLGEVYEALEDYSQALDYYQQALATAQATQTPQLQALASQGIAQVYQEQDQPEKALEILNELLQTQGLSPMQEVNSLMQISLVYGQDKDYDTALKTLQRATPVIEAIGSKIFRASWIRSIGLVYLKQENYSQAIQSLNQALELQRQVGDRSEEAKVLYDLAEAERKQGNLKAALDNIEAAIEIVESLRTNVVGSELRSLFFASKQEYYEFYIDLLMELHQQQPTQGYDVLAFQTSERARARSLLELLNEANTEIRQGVDPELVTREKQLQQQLSAIEQQRIELLGGDYTPDQRQNLEQLQAELLQQYEDIQAKIRATSPRYAALTQPQPLELPEIQQQVLEPDTLLLQYSLGEDRSYLWVVDQAGLKSYELPSRKEIELAVRNLVIAIQRPEQPQRSVKAAQALSDLILQPIQSELDQNRLLIVADGALQYIPFAALTKSNGAGIEQPLIVDHEIVSLPSASTLAIVRQETQNRPLAERKVAILADPVFSPEDERVNHPEKSSQSSNATAAQTRSQTSDQKPLAVEQLSRAADNAGIDWEPLPGTRREAEVILSLLPESEKTVAFDFQADRATATSDELSNYQIIHLATHGFANSEDPALSGLVLSLVDSEGNWQNGYLRLNDIFNLNLPAELVVLSACQTALGQNIRGEGLVGLTRGFMYAGSPRVIASLWSVDDVATAELMSRFYKQMLTTDQSPAQALRTAQLEMWQNPQWKAPYYWAAFTLQGDWRAAK